MNLVVATLKVDATPLYGSSKMIQFQVRSKLLRFRVQNPTIATQGASTIAVILDKTVTTASTIFHVATPEITHHPSGQHCSLQLGTISMRESDIRKIGDYES